MSRLVTKNNIAIFEYPPGVDSPIFNLQSDGVLWIEGYSIQFAGKPIGVMKRFETNLKQYSTYE